MALETGPDASLILMVTMTPHTTPPHGFIRIYLNLFKVWHLQTEGMKHTHTHRQMLPLI